MILSAPTEPNPKPTANCQLHALFPISPSNFRFVSDFGFSIHASRLTPLASGSTLDFGLWTLDLCYFESSSAVLQNCSPRAKTFLWELLSPPMPTPFQRMRPARSYFPLIPTT